MMHIELKMVFLDSLNNIINQEYCVHVKYKEGSSIAVNNIQRMVNECGMGF